MRSCGRLEKKGPKKDWCESTSAETAFSSKRLDLITVIYHGGGYRVVWLHRGLGPTLSPAMLLWYKACVCALLHWCMRVHFSFTAQESRRVFRNQRQAIQIETLMYLLHYHCWLVGEENVLECVISMLRENMFNVQLPRGGVCLFQPMS